MFTAERREALERDGYVVIPNVISEELADATLSEFQAFHAHATGQLFSDEDYQRDREFRNIHGIIEFPGILSHVDFVNRIREDPTVQQVFAEVYNVDVDQNPILCGMDRVNYQASENMRKIPARDQNPWWHVDQKWDQPEFMGVQGYVDMVGSETDEHGGLQVVRGSHRMFEDLALAHVAGVTEGGWERDWHRLNEEELEYCKEKGGEVVNVKCPKGGMVLWDSRTVHMSRRNHHPDDERFVVYTCGWPKSRLTQKDLARREEAKRLRRATSHHPDARHLFPAKPRWFGSTSEEPQRIGEQWI
jgi:ectoine hydroxylase-related dioxygenase (phytanoyl-CoA dioxygenase family)